MNREQSEESERGQRASFDRSTGEVHGSGADAGRSGSRKEDYDADPTAGSGAEPVGGPLPADNDEHGGGSRRS